MSARRRKSYRAQRHVETPRGLDCPTPEKWGFDTRQIARRQLRKERLRLRDERLQVYRCSCGLFHLGHEASSTLRRDLTPVMPGPKQGLPTCAKRFAGGLTCAFTPSERAVGDRVFWLCDEHWLELEAAMRRRRNEAA